jgi:AhpD family alkylhydroperoxidase
VKGYKPKAKPHPGESSTQLEGVAIVNIPTSTPPKTYERFRGEFPAIVDAYEQLGKACHHMGPLSPKCRELVKIGIALGAGLETAIKTHVRHAEEAGASPEEIRHAAVLATTTLGLPAMMRGLTWVEDVLGTG